MGTPDSGVDSFLKGSLGSIDRPIRVLYVDDEEGFLSTTKQILELKGIFQVETALAPDEALQKLEQNQFDVIVSDYQMPAKDGLTFLNELREQGIYVPFILFTGKGREEVAIKALNLGADYYISKSGQPETVYSQLSHYILQAVRKKKAEERLKYKLEFESVIARVSSRFVNYTDFNETINDSLSDIGLISGASHVYIYLLQESGTVFSHLHTWTAENVQSKPEHIIPITPAMIPWGLKQLSNGQTILINNTEMLPPEAESEKEFLKARNVKSIVVLPITVFGQFAGFIGFDNVHKTEAWNSDDVDLLQIISELIGTTLERKKTAEKLKESEKKYRLLTENTTDAIFIQDMTLKVTYASPSIETLSGYTPEEVYELKTEDFMTPESFKRGVSDFKEALSLASEGRDSEIPLKQYEYIRKDGSIFWGELKTKLLRDSEGNLLGLQGTLRDITERKATEEKLRESEKKYRLLTENITDVVFVQDLDLMVTYVSPSVETLTGYTPEEVYKLHPKEFIAPGSYERAVTTWNEAISSADNHPDNTIRLMQYEYVRKDGSTFWGEIKVMFLRDSNGCLVGTQGTLRDITERKEAEEKLNEKERTHRLLTENTTDVIFIQNLDLSIKYVSPSVEALSGYTPEEVIALGPKFLMTEESYEKGAAEFREAIGLAEKNPEVEFPFWRYQYLCKDGSRAWGEFKAKFLRDSEGNLVGMLGALRDITERKKAEDALRQEREMLELFTSNIGAGLTIISRDYKILWLNTYLRNICGDVKGKTCYSVYNDRERICPNCGVAEIFETGKDHVVHHQSVPTNDGQRSWIELVANPIKDDKCNIVAASELTVTLDDRKELQNRLREAEERYHMLFDRAPLGIIIFDTNGRPVEFNDEAHRHLGYSREEFRNLNISDIDVLDDADHVKARIKRILKHGKDEFETKHRTKNGEIRDVINTIRVIEINGKPFLHAIKRDITKRKQTEEKLAVMNAELQRLNEKLGVVGGLARHDSRNKLSVIEKKVYLVKQRLADDSISVEHLTDIESAIYQIDKIFSFTKTYEMLGAKELSYIDVHQFVDEAAMLFSDMNETKLVNSCSGLTVLADSLLRQLFYNLIENSLIHGEHVTKICVHYEELADHLHLTYEDDGIGMTDGQKEKIFMEQYGKGTGYGVYLIRKMCEVYGWTIKETGVYGKYAQFMITIPKFDKSGKLAYILA